MKNKQEESLPFSFISLGCSRTLVDSEVVLNDLQGNGFQLVPEGSKESVSVLNTCAFIQSAIDETESNIRALCKRKQEGKLKFIAVIGCYPGRFKETELKKRYPDVNIWLTTKEEHLLKERLLSLVFTQKYQPNPSKKNYIRLTPSHYAYIKISEGCDNWCSFCTIPKIRGEHRSKPVKSILNEIEQQVAFGVKEILLVAEDTTAWGIDIFGEPRFDYLLESLAGLPVKWIRPMYIFPSRVNDQLIEVMANTKNICPYIDMPIQHVSSRILEKMNRRHDHNFLEKLMDKFFERIPHIAIRTTFLLGFPGEKDEDIEEICRFIERYPIAHIGCFAYSDEANTRSRSFKDKCDPKVIEKRIAKIMNKQFEQIKKRFEKRKNQKITILYEGNSIARSYWEAPEVDSLIHIVGSDKASLISGHFYQATIIDSKGYDLIATIDDPPTY